MFGRHHSEETKEKMRKKATGKRHSLETRMKISKAKKGKPSHWKGKHHSLQTKKKLSEINKGKVISEEQRQKLSDAWVKKVVLQYDLDGNFIREWNSVREIAKAYNCTGAAIRMCCIGKNSKSAGFVWKYKDEVEG